MRLFKPIRIRFNFKTHLSQLDLHAKELTRGHVTQHQWRNKNPPPLGLDSKLGCKTCKNRFGISRRNQFMKSKSRYHFCKWYTLYSKVHFIKQLWVMSDHITPLKLGQLRMTATGKWFMSTHKVIKKNLFQKIHRNTSRQAFQWWKSQMMNLTCFMNTQHPRQGFIYYPGSSSSSVRSSIRNEMT